jgi:hypothetical protein
MTEPPESQPPFRPELHEAEAELEERLREACDVEDVRAESTGELMRLEDALTSAAQAAKHAISLRRRIRTWGEMEPPPRGVGAPGEARPGVREFTDARGLAWRVWQVSPEQSHGRRKSETYSGEYSAGWLVFEALDGSVRKRLPHYPAHWADLPSEGLEALLAEARAAPHRKSGGADRGEEPRA